MKVACSFVKEGKKTRFTFVTFFRRAKLVFKY
jgi:hypothetical protein